MVPMSEPERPKRPLKAVPLAKVMLHSAFLPEAWEFLKSRSVQGWKQNLETVFNVPEKTLHC